MKKIFILFILLFTSGCTIVRIDTTDIDNTIGIILSKENKLYNRVGKGYKYYIPRGVTYIDTDELNDKLYSNGNYYYLYIDAINYYYQTAISYTEDKSLYYSKKIDINGRDGYLEIKKKDNKYLVTFVYNYAKIETIVEEEEINDVILNCSYILSTIKFNHNVIKLMLNEDYLTNKEEIYDLFVPRKTITNHIDYKSDDGNSIEEDNKENVDLENQESNKEEVE